MKYIKFFKPMCFNEGAYAIDQIGAFENIIADKLVEQGYGEEVTLESTNIYI